MVGTHFYFFLIFEMEGYLTESKRKFQNIEEINEKNETRIETSKIEKIHAKKSGDIPAMKW